MLLKVASTETESKAMIYAKNAIEELRAMGINGKNVLGIDKALEGQLTDIREIVTSYNDGKSDREITSIGLEFADRIILVPVSREFDHDVLADARWYKSVLRINNTRRLNADGSYADPEGEFTGPETVTFGMPGEPNVVSNRSMLETVEVKTK